MSLSTLVAKHPLRRPAKGVDVRAVQLALRAAGAELVVDGDFGAITEAAVRRFQAVHDLAVDGEVGPFTAAALNREESDGAPVAPLSSVLGVAPWLSTMRALTGTKEIPGAADSPIILGWRDAIEKAFPDVAPGVRGYTHDAVPWCGLTVAYCMAQADQHPPLAPLYATNWFYRWDEGIRLDGPALGAVLVKTRNGGGHVTLYEGEDDHFYFCRGGNQSDAVNVTRIPKVGAGVLGFMWPAGFPRPLVAPVRATFAEAREGSEA